MKNKLFLGLGTFISLIGLSQINVLAASSESGSKSLGAELHGASLSYVCFYV